MVLCACLASLVLGCGRETVFLPPPPPLAGGLGLSTHIPTGGAPQEAAARAFELRMDRAAGAALLRRDFVWGEIEPSPGAFTFEAYDRMVDDALSSGMEFIGLLTYAPPWAQKTSGSDSSVDPADFARFVYETVRHFSGRVSRWEVWNEPNWIYWTPAPDPAAYGALLRAAYTAAKAADPGCSVAFGGLNSTGDLGTWGFLQRVYDLYPDIGGYFDALAFHPYTFLQALSPEGASVQGNLREMIRAVGAVLADHGDGGKPLWITELGWPAGPGEPSYSYPPNLTSEEQAAWLVRSVLLSASEGVGTFCWYTFIDQNGSAQPSSENYFGLVEFDGTPKESYAAYAALTRIIGPLHFARDMRDDLRLGADDYGLLFASAAGDVRVLTLWRAGKGVTGTVEVPASHPVTIADIRGQASVRIPVDGAVPVDVSNDPVYVTLP